MDLGSRDEAWPAEATSGLLAPTWVLFFVRLRAILLSDCEIKLEGIGFYCLVLGEGRGR